MVMASFRALALDSGKMAQYTQVASAPLKHLALASSIMPREISMQENGSQTNQAGLGFTFTSTAQYMLATGLTTGITAMALNRGQTEVNSKAPTSTVRSATAA